MPKEVKAPKMKRKFVFNIFKIKKHKKYIEEINKIEDFIYDGDKVNYHIMWDDLLVEILEENGYKDIAKMYNEASKHFWYS